MISKTGEAETITTHYLFFLGLYRALYLANWIWRYQTENFYDQISVVSGVVQTIFYCDFFYLYVTRGRDWCCHYTLYGIPADGSGPRLIPSGAYVDGGGTDQWEPYLCTDENWGLLTNLVRKYLMHKLQNGPWKVINLEMQTN